MKLIIICKMESKTELFLQKFAECQEKMELLSEEDKRFYEIRLEKMVDELYERMDLQTEFLSEMIAILSHKIHSRIKIKKK